MIMANLAQCNETMACRLSSHGLMTACVWVYPDGTELQSCCMEPGSTTRELTCGESDAELFIYLMKKRSVNTVNIVIFSLEQ